MKIQLSKIEARLQSLVEGGAARIFPEKEKHRTLLQRLVAVMKENVKKGEGNEIIAPNLYLIYLHPSQVQVIRENPIYLEHLAQMLAQEALAAGFHFPSPPVVRLIDSPQLLPDQMEITAQNSLENLPQTSDIEVKLEEDPESIPQNAYLIVNGTQMINLNQAIINIGRRPDNQLIIDDARVSRVHAQLRAIRGHYVIFDLDSTGGTWVNNKRIRQATLFPGDVVSLSGVPLVFGQDTAPSGATQNFVPPLP
jgi:hypothetical protein